MKHSLLAISFLLGAANLHAAAVFWAFQTDPDALTNSYTTAPTNVSGITGTPSITTFNGDTAQFGSNGGQSTFTYVPTGQTYLGSGNSGGNTASLGWNSNDSTDYTGTGFTIALNTTNLTDLSLSFAVRAATSSSGLGQAPQKFATIEYSLDDGTMWTTAPATQIAKTWARGTSFVASPTFDLSSLDAIENRSSVLLRFILEPTPKSGSPTVFTNLRIDNLVLNAVPEPSAVALVAMMGGFALMRRKR